MARDWMEVRVVKWQVSRPVLVGSDSGNAEKVVGFVVVSCSYCQPKVCWWTTKAHTRLSTAVCSFSTSTSSRLRFKARAAFLGFVGRFRPVVSGGMFIAPAGRSGWVLSETCPFQKFVRGRLRVESRGIGVVGLRSSRRLSLYISLPAPVVATSPIHHPRTFPHPTSKSRIAKSQQT